MVRKILFLTFTLYFTVCVELPAQKPLRYSASDILLKMEKLKVLGNVLYVAAHPDDENTGIITYFANEEKVNTAYFSFTRGDGGQNLIGPEITEELGLIRTHELLQARQIDKGEQFFSRAVDFGYSKHPDETFTIWDKDAVLGDLVWVIRKYRPDVIINRFDTVAGTTHGHHTASALLSFEAMDLAGDAGKYPEQLAWVQPWQPKSLYWNAYFWRRSDYQRDTAELIGVNVGKYNELLGMSYTELSALSRSSHKSQGFGATGTRGARIDYLQHEKGYKPAGDVFNGIDITWNRVSGSKGIEKKIDDIITRYNPRRPELSLQGLLELRASVNGLKDEFWKNRKIAEIDELIYAVAGLFLEVKAKDYTAYPGESLDLDVEVVNRSDARIILESVRFPQLGVGDNYTTMLRNNEAHSFVAKVSLPENYPYSYPYWLENPHGLGMFEVERQEQIGKPVNGPSLEAEFILNVQGQRISFEKPVIFKRNDPVEGEVYRPFYITPPVFVNINGDVKLFADRSARQITVKIRAGKSGINGQLKLELPKSWQVTPSVIPFEMEQKYSEQSFVFEVTPPADPEIAYAKPVAIISGEEYPFSIREIDYSHIPYQLIINRSDVKFVKLELNKANERIGYIMGAGDNIPDNLRQIGYEVDLINGMEFSEENLSRYDVIILGIRALNTVDRLRFDMEKLFGFVERGGNLIVQYNTSHALVASQIAPYALQLSRDRITVEDASVRFLAPDHSILNFPNKISPADFDGWVQERGLYFPSKWDNAFVPILSSADPGEESLPGGLLVAPYGKGHYIYTGYSWFRELPAGVPGAYRIFVNMISMGKN